MTEPLPETENLLANEYAAVRALRETLLAKDLHDARSDLLANIRKVTQSANLGLIVATEKAVVRGDLSRYANSKAMTHSLQAALDDLAIIEKHLDIIADKSRYQFVAEVYSRPRNRKNGLPLDEARQALASHHGRLENMDKSRLDEDEKAIVEARKAAMKMANDLYIALQEKALGMDDQAQQAQEQEQTQMRPRPRGRGR